MAKPNYQTTTTILRKNRDLPYALFYLKETTQFVKLFAPTSAWLYYHDHKVDLLKPPHMRQRMCARPFEGESFNVRFYFYEYGMFQNLGLKTEHPLGMEFHFSKQEFLCDQAASSEKIQWNLKECMSFDSYKTTFEKGQSYLAQGECYQFNLTYPFTFSASEPISLENALHDWMHTVKLQTQGAYAHALVLPMDGQLFATHSPECLFEAEPSLGHSQRVWTVPIKGTIKRSFDIRDDRKLWKQLSKCPKNHAELTMITDLLRNDLSRFGDEFYSRVIKLKAPVYTSHLLHQSSIIETEKKGELDLDRLMQALFPGGSITGAPKKRVMEILSELENQGSTPRGFYCGSTIVTGKKRTSASINIRSFLFDKAAQSLTAYAGGGITILSDAKEEYQEMKNKISSFISISTRGIHPNEEDLLYKS